jgi:hypothetical protein
MEEVGAYVPPQFIAHAWSAQNVLAQPIIVLSLSSLDGDLRIVTHELTHVIAFNVIPHQPAWLSEGIAGYFETLRLDEARGKVDVGRPLDFRVRQIRSDGLTPTAALFACEQPACMDDRFYATTWALITYLVNHHRSELVQYMARLIETPKEQQSKLWAEVFPALPPAALDHELAQWAAYGKIQVSEYKHELTATEATQRGLLDSDALAARGLLRYLFAPNAVPAEITEALSLDATAVLPNMIRAAVVKEMDGEKARAVAAAHPDDWRAWWLVGRATSGTKDSHEARVKMCALLEKNPAALPPRMCSEAALDPSKDPRRAVFTAALPQINTCLKAAKDSANPAGAMSIEVEINDAGSVTKARASVGPPDVNACVEGVLRALTFPPHHAGTFRVGR